MLELATLCHLAGLGAVILPEVNISAYYRDEHTAETCPNDPPTRTRVLIDFHQRHSFTIDRRRVSFVVRACPWPIGLPSGIGFYQIH